MYIYIYIWIHVRIRICMYVYNIEILHVYINMHHFPKLPLLEPSPKRVKNLKIQPRLGRHRPQIEDIRAFRFLRPPR